MARLYENTPENQYEIRWAVRDEIMSSLMPQADDIQTLLDIFTEADGNVSIGLVATKGIVQGTGEERHLLTGATKVETRRKTTNKALAKHRIGVQWERVQFLSRYIDDDTDAVVELGSGFGLNLFRLAHVLGDRAIDYVSAEFTGSGRALCRKLTDVEGAPPLRVEFIDHKAPDVSFLAGYRKVLIFTAHSIEQVNTLPDDYFAILAGAAETVVGIHMEPFGFQVRADTPEARAQKEWIEGRRWNVNFYSCLEAAASRGEVQIEDVLINAFDLLDGNPTSVAIWRNQA